MLRGNHWDKNGTYIHVYSADPREFYPISEMIIILNPFWGYFRINGFISRGRGLFLGTF